MLIQFSFKNYKSFRDETVLDLSACKMTEFSERIVSVGSENILPVAAIFGANASGKSNVYSAFDYMSSYVADSFGYGDEAKDFSEIRPRPFLFDSDTENGDTSFEVYFTVPGDNSQRIYNYGFCIGEEGVTEEWFNYKGRTSRKYVSVFYRNSDTLVLTGIPRASRDNIEVALEKQVLIVSLGAKLKVSKCKLVRDWFLGNEFADFGDATENLFMEHILPVGFVDNENVRNDVVRYLSTFDETIKGFEVDKLSSDNNGVDKYRIYALHKRIGSEDYVKLPLKQESAGTLKMFSLYPKLQEVLENGGLFFVDELNARLHPLLVRNFILTFLNPDINVNHAQLIFTTHDSWQLSNQLLRRDEIWFTDKDKDGVSSLYSLADFVDEDGDHIRKDENYEKNYLVGKYGAIPFLRSIKL